MTRLAFALPLVLLSVPAWSQPAPLGGEPNFSLSDLPVARVALPAPGFIMPDTPVSWESEGRLFASTQIAPNATFGLGMFGLKSQRSGMAPTTVREINSSRTRRAAMGFSFKF